MFLDSFLIKRPFLGEGDAYYENKILRWGA